jgi:5-(carboxyamino)imidazole ribonucleotide synthase
MSTLLPGATLGIIGGGQLARMMTLEARRMGYRVCLLSPDPSAPAAGLADQWVRGSLDDVDAAEKLAEVSDVITVDTEHVPASMLAYLELLRPVRPSSSVLRTIQDRRVQRVFLDDICVEQPRWESIPSAADLHAAVAAVGTPCVLKRSHAGYDGKGQRVISSVDQVEQAWGEIGGGPAVVESFVRFDCEVSVLLARNPRGEVRFYPMAHNRHQNHVLRASVAPAPVPQGIEARGFEIAARIANALDHVGMMAVEMYLVGGTELLVNEIAPRPHNSGHYTFGGCVTSQFEQHVRAVLDLPLGDTSLPRPAAMVNLFGDLWRHGEPDWRQVLSQPEARLPLYDKAQPRPGRKMGHVLVLNEDPDLALQTGEALLARLESSSATHQRVNEMARSG